MANNSDSSPKHYQHVIVHGLPFARGHSHGEQTKEKIIKSLKFYKEKGFLDTWDKTVEFVRKNYIPAIVKYFPMGLEEMRGIAHGSETTIEEIVILNARYDLNRWKLTQKCPTDHLNADVINECTAIACLPKGTKNDDVLLAQNWDYFAPVMEEDTAILLEVHPDPSENIPPLITLTEAGQLARSGINANGLGLTANGLNSSEDHFDLNKFENNLYLPMTLIRRMFLESPTFPKALYNIIDIPRHVSCNITVGTAEGEAMCLEMTPNNYYVIYPHKKTEIVTHANNFKSIAFLSREGVKDTFGGDSSLFRDRRLEKGALAIWPNIDEDGLKNAFKDHLGYPNALCEHKPDVGMEYISIDPKEVTVACVIYNLNKKTVTLCKGPPCQGQFATYRFSY